MKRIRNIIFILLISLFISVSVVAKQLPAGTNYNYSIDMYTDTFYITYDLDGGYLSDRVNTYTPQDNDINIGIPTKSGYMFIGWTGTNGNIPNTRVAIKHNSIYNYNLKANWQLIPYNIAYDLNGGEGESGPIYYNIETDSIILGQPYRQGYEFIGWTGENGTNPQKEIQIPKDNKRTLNYKANWKEKTYKIYYKSREDGSASNSNIQNYTEFTINSTLQLTNPTRPGYNFTGWIGSNGNNKNINVNIEKGTVGDRFYEANWGIITYNLTYNLNGGNVNPANPSTYNVETQTITLNNPTRTGYTFDGWIGTNEPNKNKNVKINRGSIGNRNFTANWTANKYKVHFNSNNGTGNMSDVTYTYDQTYNLPNNAFTRNGYIFKNWNTKADGTGTSYNNQASVRNLMSENNSTINLYAQWNAVNYNITYDLKGGTGVSNRTYNIETNTFTLPNPTKPGFRFDGWTGSNGTTPQTDVTINKGTTGNKSYTANWTQLTFNITYDYKGGVVNPANPLTYNVNSETFTLINPTKYCHTFVGYTGTGLTSASKNVSIAKGSTGNRAYTALWQINKYSIDVNPVISGAGPSNNNYNNFVFDVYKNGTIVKTGVHDYFEDATDCGTVYRVVAKSRTGYNITAHGDETKTVESNTEFNPTWYDNIAPTISDFTITDNGWSTTSPNDPDKDVTIGANVRDRGSGVKKVTLKLNKLNTGNSHIGYGSETIISYDTEARWASHHMRDVVVGNRTFCITVYDYNDNKTEQCESRYFAKR